MCDITPKEVIKDIQSTAQIIRDIFGKNNDSSTDENNLAVVVHNDTGQDIIIDYYISQGSSKQIPMTGLVKNGKSWKCGLVAEESVSNIGIVVVIPNGDGTNSHWLSTAV